MPKATVKDVKELPEVLTMEQVQQFLGISRPKAYELANSQTFPSIRIGRSIRVTRRALMRWLETQAEEAVQ